MEQHWSCVYPLRNTKTISHNPRLQQMMASSMVVPVSKDTLFMRGFSSRHTVDEIREHFGRDGDRMPTVEFFKLSDDRSQLFVALRFESKDKAKDVINRYNGTDILGDHVNMTWFKDLRRMRGRYRMDMGNRYRRWSPPQRGDYWDRDQYHYGGGRQWRGRSPTGRQSRRYEHSSSRSVSRSRSRSASQSRSRSRDKANNRSHSSESHDDNKRGRSRGKRDSERQQLSPRDQSSDNEPRERKRHRNKPEVEDGDKNERKHKTTRKDASSSEDESDKVAESAVRKQSSERSDRGTSSDRSPVKGTKPIRSAVSTVETSTAKYAHESRYDRYDADINSTPAEKVTGKAQRDEQSPGDYRAYQESGYERGQKSSQQQNSRSSNRKRVDSMRSEEDDIADNPESPPFNKQTVDYSERNNRCVDEEMPASDDGRHVAKTLSEPRDSERQKTRTYVSDEEEEGEVADCRPNVSLVDYDVKTSRRSSAEKSVSNSSKKRHEEARTHRDSKLDQTEQNLTSRQSAPEGSRTSDAHKASNGGIFSKEMHKGALTLPQDKMSIVREKKDEIEKAYRQDCETFAVVVKMLISKDDELEEKLQKSLRENLKEIGQRCIQELREFIEEVKVDSAC